MDVKGKVGLCPVVPDIPNSIPFYDLGCRRDVSKICGVLGHSVACSDKSLQTFREIHFFISWPLKMGRIGCPETSAVNYHCTLRNIPKQRRYQHFFSSCALSVRPLINSSIKIKM